MTMKKILSIALLWATTTNLTAQTYYYRFVKSVIKGVENRDVSGGQYITFEGKKCWESDCNGNSVGNGSMTLDPDNSDNDVTIYWGACYYSPNANFKFNKDKTLLNIETTTGKIYVYRQSTAPAGVLTCSLIRKANQYNAEDYTRSNRASTSNNHTQQPVMIVNNTYNSQDRQQKYERPQRQQPVQHVCSVCHGEKTIVKDMNPPSFGTPDVKKYCSRCGKYFYQSTGHCHIPCPECHGKGYWISK